MESELILYVNGEKLLEADDEGFAFGRDGLLVYRLNVSFDDFLITNP